MSYSQSKTKMKVLTVTKESTHTLVVRYPVEFYNMMCYKWDNVFKNGPSKTCARQPLKNLKGYGLLKQTISLQFF